MTSFLVYMTKAAAGLALFYAFFWLFLRKETFFFLNRVYLVSALFLSFLVPAFPLPSPFASVPAASPGIFPAGPPSASAPSFSVGAALALIYAAGFFLFLARFAHHIVRLRTVIRRNGIRRWADVKLVTVEEDFSPFSFLDIIFVNDRRLTPGDLHRILAHERVHIRQLHTLDVMLMELVTILQWFNPLVWPYKKSLQETHEYLADSGVIAQGFGAVRYQRLMVEQHVGARLFEVGNNFKQSQIKRRITMMSRNRSSGASKLKFLMALPLTLALVLAFAVPRTAAAKNPATPQANEKATGHELDAETKQRVAKAVDELKKLGEVEAELKKKLETTSDAELQAKLQAKLEEVLQRRVECVAIVKKAGVPLPPTPPPPGMQADLKVMMKELKAKEEAIRGKLESATDPADQAKLKEMLEATLKKQAEVKSLAAQIGSGGGAPPPPAPGNGHFAAPGTPPASPPPPPMTMDMFKKALVELAEKESEIRSQLEKTEDPQKKAELQEVLAKVLKKQEATKAKLAEFKAAKEQKEK